MEPVILKVVGGWINVAAIRYAETVQDPRTKEIGVSVAVENRPQPIFLKGGDAKRITAYLDSRTWQPACVQEDVETQEDA